jgi:hypothetical protein
VRRRLAVALLGIPLQDLWLHKPGQHQVDRASFSVTRHGLLPLLGAAVACDGIWDSIKPGQGFPANRYWILVLLYVVLAVAGAVTAMKRWEASHEALARGLEDI